MKLGTNGESFFAAWRKPCPPKVNLYASGVTGRVSRPKAFPGTIYVYVSG